MLTALFLAEPRYRPRVPATHQRCRKLGGCGDHKAEPLGICDPGCAPATPGNPSRIVDLKSKLVGGTGHYLNSSVQLALRRFRADSRAIRCLDYYTSCYMTLRLANRAPRSEMAI
jgi:hypothetical protein